MSPGARNWPFLMLTGLPERATGVDEVGLAAQEGRGLQHVDDARHFRNLFLGVDVGQDRHADFLAHVGQDLQALFRPGPRKDLPDERLALSNDDL
jgi:hypothetical protein